MKVLLVNPHTYSSAKGLGAPLSLAYLAAFIRDAHDVRIMDLMVEDKPQDALLKCLRRFKPDIVGVTCNTAERFGAFDIARTVKGVDAGIMTVLGGAHVTFTAREIMERIPEVDVCVLFEGEITLREICDGKELSQVKGIAYRSVDKVYLTEKRPFIENLDMLPFPARDLLKMEKYDLKLPIPSRPLVTNLVANRGCPFGCKFCSATQLCGLKIRSRSAENVVEEMELVMKDYTFLDGVFIYDDHFTLNKKLAIEICGEIKERGLDVRWGCFSRVDSIDRPTVREMKSAGCEMIGFGVESGSPKILKAMNKNITPDMIRNAVGIVKSEGVEARATVIFGYPGETWLDITRTFRVLASANLKPSEIGRGCYLMLFPGAGVYDQLAPKVLPKDFNWVDRFDIPNYKDIPLYTPPNNRARMLFIKLMKGIYRIKK